MVIIEDVGQKIGHHDIKNNYWKSQGVEVKRLPLPTGDYCLMSDKVQDVINRKLKRGLSLKKMDFLGSYNVGIDTKENIQELYGNIINNHDRFRDELLLAQNNGIKLYILTENTDGVTCIEDVAAWINPRVFIWEKDIRKMFVQKQKEIYRYDNAIEFFEKRNIDIWSGKEELEVDQVKKFVHDQYFKQLKSVPLEEILVYLKKINLKHKKKPADSTQLVKSMLSMQEKYGVTFLFCEPKESGKKIVELLTDK